MSTDGPTPSDEELRVAIAAAEQRVIEAEKAVRALKPMEDQIRRVRDHHRECQDDLEVLLKEMRQRMGGANRRVTAFIPAPDPPPHPFRRKGIPVPVSGHRPNRKRLLKLVRQLCSPAINGDTPD